MKVSVGENVFFIDENGDVFYKSDNVTVRVVEKWFNVDGKFRSEFVVPLFKEVDCLVCVVVELKCLNDSFVIVYDENVFEKNKVLLFDLLGFNISNIIIFDNDGEGCIG